MTPTSSTFYGSNGDTAESQESTTINSVVQDDAATPAQAAPRQPQPPARVPTSNPHLSPPFMYNPQFSKTTQMILSRMKKESGTAAASSPSPQFSATQLPAPVQAAYEDTKRRLVESLNTTTLALPLPKLPPAPSTPTVPTVRQPPPASSSNMATKRKRQIGEEEERPTKRPTPPRPNEASIAIPPPPKAPHKRKRIKDETMCVKCQRTSFTNANVIIPCACGEAWHQLCHEPQIAGETAQNRASFKCSTCVKEAKEQAKYQAESAKYREAKQEQAGLKRLKTEVAKQRERRLANLPPFPKPELVGFEAGDASNETRMDYFSKLNRRDLANLLCFCDQIEPGLLANLLTSVSRRHPHLPIFNTPDWAQPKMVRRSSSRRLQMTNGGPTHQAPTKNSKQRSKTGGVRKILKTKSVPSKVVPRTADDDDDDGVPSTWRPAGKGFYAQLPPEREDSRFLVDDNDEEAFSHFMVDKRGKQIMDPVKG
ncbi:phd finger domain-containing protein [Colletotrichum sojae]|uniref:Phd finger domain-containing protein n=1 Tax=Colletotrichum sojae TaxID=2175907 RepID=A0A8H6MLF0_9PEZI|nr:phd finger domain-containing protein [Colletotrichum sojae]